MWTPLCADYLWWRVAWGQAPLPQGNWSSDFRQRKRGGKNSCCICWFSVAFILKQTWCEGGVFWGGVSWSPSLILQPLQVRGGGLSAQDRKGQFCSVFRNPFWGFISEVKFYALIPPLACKEERFLDPVLVFLNRLINSNELLVFILLLDFYKLCPQYGGLFFRV